MGACCSQVAEAPPPSTKSFARITDSELQLRIPSSPPASEECKALLESAHISSLQCFTRAADMYLKPDFPPLDSKEITQKVMDVKEDVVDGFRRSFRQGSSGEAVPFAMIKSAEETLRIALTHQSAIVFYCNMYRSFRLCSSLKRRIIEDELHGNGVTNKGKLMRIYDKSAAGIYANMCRNDLECLLDQSTKLTSAVLVTLLKKQFVADREILKKECSKAEAVSGRKVPSAFASFVSENSSDGEESYAALQSRLSVLDIIERLPEDDGETAGDLYAGDDFFTLQGEVVAMAPLKKHRSADDYPLQFPRKDALDSTNSSQKADKFDLLENAEESTETSHAS